MRASRPSRGVDRSPLLYSCGASPPPACRRQGLHGGERRETGVLLAALLRLLCAVGVTAIHRDACWPGAGMPIEGPIRSQRLGAAVRERRAGPAPAACCTNTPSVLPQPRRPEIPKTTSRQYVTLDSQFLKARFSLLVELFEFGQICSDTCTLMKSLSNTNPKTGLKAG